MHGSIGPSAALARWRASALEIRATRRARSCSALRWRAPSASSPGDARHSRRGRAATDTTAPTTPRSTRRCWRARSPDGPCSLEVEARRRARLGAVRPATVVDVPAGLDAEGRIIDWSLECCGLTHIGRACRGARRARGAAGRRTLAAPSAPPAPCLAARRSGIHRNAMPIYDVPRSGSCKHSWTDNPLRTSSLRSLGAYTNVFAIESMMDELAAAAGVDPLEFRLAHLADERARAVLEAAAERGGLEPSAPRRTRAAWASAFARYKNKAPTRPWSPRSEVDDATARDPARARRDRRRRRPDRRSGRACATSSRAASCSRRAGRCTRRCASTAGGVASRDWESYPILRFPEVPEVERADRPPGEPLLGAGEATQGPTAAAIANAVHARHRRARARHAAHARALAACGR